MVNFLWKNNLIDATSITKKQEINILSKCKYIIDFAHYEYEFLIRNLIKFFQMRSLLELEYQDTLLITHE